MNEALAALARLVQQETGIVLTDTHETALRAALNRAAPGVEPATFLRRTSDPARGRSLVERLVDEVTVKETTFVRDRHQLDAIAWHLLLERAREAGSDTIRVWSAGCATGEEPYTLALLASEAFAPADPPVDVLGTDVSPFALEAAAAGMYRERAVRALGETQRRRYLETHPQGIYSVGASLRRLVRFARHNLARDPIPPLGEEPFDLVLCRNVLIYFDAPLIERVIEGLERSVRPGGTLVIGAADALYGTTSRLAALTARPVPGTQAARRVLRQPLGRELELSREERVEAALAAAGTHRRGDAIAHADALLAADPLDADAYFLRGMVELEAGDAQRAVTSLRRALYIDPTFALASFTLGRAHDRVGDETAAKRAYEQALRTLDPEDRRHELLLQQVDLGDVAAACRARLSSLR